MSGTAKKLSIICFSGDFDKLVSALTLATGSAALGYEVNIFFTFWGLNVIKRKAGRTFPGKGFFARTFGFLSGGRNNVPLSRLNFMGTGPRLMTFLMRKRNVATLNDLLDAAKALKINLYACEMSMIILGMDLKDFIPEVREVLGVAKFLELSEGGDRLFI